MSGSSSTMESMRNAVGARCSTLQSCEQPSLSAVLPSSHSSPGSTTPLPHSAVQSSSVLALAPRGQQPSPSCAAVMGACVQWASQLPPPTRVSVVHVSPSSQLVGQAPAPERMPVSHVSPGSTTPLPQLAAQSLSLPEVAPGGQQPSPLRGTVIGVNRQCALQVPPSTTSSVVHASPSSQLVGHTPAPEVIAVSHISPGSRWPSPQLAAQSLS